MTTPRLPFDPSKMAAASPIDTSSPAAAAQALSDQPLSVSQLSARIDTALKRGLPDVLRVIGEISGFRERTHWYFDLKDAEACVNCAVFASAARKLPFMPANGQQVVARGRIDYYAKAGKVTFIIDKLEPVGAGALDLAYRKLVDEVRSLGWFAQERKRPLPLFPRRIAVITSRSAAALQDVLDTMRRRCPAVGVLLVDVRVQGDVAPEIIRAVRHVSRYASSLRVDAVLITRGGGSAEDLFLFNNKEIARAIVECSIPVVAAIGHETDTTIAELVADLRAATPTQAAMRLTPDALAFQRQLDTSAGRIHLLLRRRAESARTHLRSLERSRLFADPHGVLEDYFDSVDAHARELHHAVQHRLAAARQYLSSTAASLERARPAAVVARMSERLKGADHALLRALSARLASNSALLDARARQLHAVSPLSVLDRGFSVTTTANGALLRSPASASAGDTLHTRLAAGTVTSIVTGTKAGPLRRQRRATTESPDQPGLFP